LVKSRSKGVPEMARDHENAPDHPARSVAPLDVDEIQRYVERGRQLHAEAMNRAARGAAAGLAMIAWRVAVIVRGAARSVARPSPHGDYRLARVPLTGHRR
jgi:hypothetical protein